MKFQLLVVSLFAVAAQCAMAAKTEPPIQAKSKADFEKAVAQVRAEMAPNGRYATLTDGERKKVDDGIGNMSQLFDKTPNVDNMSDTDKRAMFNTQEVVNAALLKRDGDRLVCTKETRSGSHFPTTTCRSVREIERDRRNGQDWYQNTTMHNPLPKQPGN